MQTRRLTNALDAADLLRAGGLVAFPTETVFGLGVDATNQAAVHRLFSAKGRPTDNPLIVHVGDVDEWPLVAERLTRDAEALLAEFAPGPLTVVLPKRSSILDAVTAGLPTVGLRVPSHSIATELLRAARLPVAAPSANRSGRPSCTTWRSVLHDLDGRIDAVLCYDCDAIGVESTVVDCTGSRPVLLRPGSVTLDQLREVAPETVTRSGSGAAEPRADAVRSPGLAHPHYQPAAEVVLVERPPSSAAAPAAYCGLAAPEAAAYSLVRTYADADRFAADFYEFLREADQIGVQTIYVQRVPEVGIGVALADRQRRAAGE